jgi:hypothetical protein
MQNFNTWLDGQKPPMIEAMLVTVQTQNGENEMEGAENVVLGDISKEASGDITQMDGNLQQLSDYMNGLANENLTPTQYQNAMTEANATLNVWQSKSSQLNTNLSAQVQAVQTGVTDLTQTQAQTLQSFQIVLNWLSKLSGNLEALK